MHPDCAHFGATWPVEVPHAVLAEVDSLSAAIFSGPPFCSFHFSVELVQNDYVACLRVKTL